jgi:hypothetical protein
MTFVYRPASYCNFFNGLTCSTPLGPGRRQRRADIRPSTRDPKPEIGTFSSRYVTGFYSNYMRRNMLFLLQRQQEKIKVWFIEA